MPETVRVYNCNFRRFFSHRKIISFCSGLQAFPWAYSGPCSNLASFKAASSGRRSWRKCAPCWRGIRTGAAAAAASIWPGSGTGATPPVNSKTWRRVRSCSNSNNAVGLSCPPGVKSPTIAWAKNLLSSPTCFLRMAPSSTSRFRIYCP